jgi:sugar O-acyltransferase (sialic acid O-acetyltransferase NeuD family)
MKTVIVGAGGHARVVCSIIDSSYHDIEVVGFIDNFIKAPNERIYNRPIISDDGKLEELIANEIAIAAIVGIGDNQIRKQKYDKLILYKFLLINAVHKSATIAMDAKIGKGTVIASGSIVCPLAEIGDNVIVNTGSIIEHETIVGNHCHIAPGVNVAGRVTIGAGTLVGIGSTIKEYVNVGENVTIGAGTVVLDDIPDHSVVVGVPGKIIQNKLKG